MSVYPPKVNARFRSPSKAGRLPEPNAVGTSASFQCGSYTRMSLSISPGSKVIRDARFQTNGCGFMTATADAIAESLVGRGLTQLHSVDELEFVREIETTLGEFPETRRQCAHVVLEALRSALSHHREHMLGEFNGETPIICTCFGVSQEAIETFITANSPADVEDVTAGCRAGGGCGSCRMLIQEIIDASMG